jgi:hypothetical protein
MKMKSIIILLAVLNFISCKEISNEKGYAENLNGKSSLDKVAETYAEISIKEDGVWKESKYIGGNYQNKGRVEIPKNHTDHSNFIRYEGPGWENNQVGYRLYLDWRNAIDIFGKKTDTLVLPFVGQDDLGSYHNESPWGMDILKAGNSLGIGGFGRYVNNSVTHFENVGKTVVEINNNEGQSSVGISYHQWNTENEIINLNARLSIFPNDRFTKVELTPSKDIEGLCTGIVKNEGIPVLNNKGNSGNWNYIATYGKQTLANKEDKLGMAIFFNSGQVEKTLQGKDDHLIVFKASSKTITYYFLGAWEQELNGIRDEVSFKKYLEETLLDLNKSGELNP